MTLSQLDLKGEWMPDGDLIEMPEHGEDIPWFTQYQKVLDLAIWLDEMGEFENTAQMLEYFKEPYKWSAQWIEHEGTE